MDSIGSAVESKGWLQGCFIPKDKAMRLLQSSTLIDLDLDDLRTKEFDLVVVTQSCNLANNSVNTVQLAVAYHIEERERNKEYNKHPRELDTFYTLISGDDVDSETTQINIRICILEKIFAHKSLLLETTFSDDILFADQELRSFVEWLGCHYTKPALPTQFNSMIDAEKRKNSKKSRKKEKKLSADFLGIYVAISPDRDLEEDESYDVNLLGITPPKADIENANQCLKEYALLLADAGMEVKHRAMPSNKVSIHLLQDFKRLYLDELSYGAGDEPPPDVRPGIN